MTTATANATTPTRSFGRSRSVPAPESSNAIRKRGWGAVAKVAATVGSNADLFLKVEEQKKLIAFVNADPFDWNTSHWLEWIAEGSKSVICWDSLKDDEDNFTMPERCPLCAAGDKPVKLSVFFNVISLENPEDPALKVWEVGKMVYKLIEDYADDPKTSPLNKVGLFFEVSKSGDQKKPVYKLVPVKGRDFEEDYGFPAPSPEAIAELAKDEKTSPVKDPLPLDKMRELADKLP